MESPESTERTSPVVVQKTDFPLWDSGNEVPFGLPRHHRPNRLGDIAEDAELDFEDESSCDSDHVNTPREDEKVENPDDGRAQTTPRESEVDYPGFIKAIVRGDVDFVKSQLELCVDIERKTDDDFSPLVIAIMEEQIDIVKLLLEKGASVHGRSRKLPVLTHAVMKPNHGLHLMQLLLNKGAVLKSISGPDQKNVLHWAASEGMTEALDFLISKGMDIEARCSKGRTPLVLAAEAGNVDVAKVLWAQGANIHATTDNGGTALTWAACGNNVETLKFLLGKGAKVDHKDKNGHTALSLASHFGHHEIVKALLDAGADINTRSDKPKGCTPAMAAACTNSVDVLTTLIASGANLMLCSTHGDTALDIALIERKEDAVKVLLEAMGGENYPKSSVALQIAMANGHAMIKALMTTTSLMYSYMEDGARNEYMWVDWVLRQGGDILKQATMAKMLHAAMGEHDLLMIRALFKRGCDVDLHLESGHTCLSFAVRHRDLELAKMLLDAGADPNKPVPDPEGHNYTSFDHAIIGLQDGVDTEVVDLLLASGRCRINKGRDLGSTAFSFVLDKAQEWAPGVADCLAIRMINSISNVDEERDDTGCTLLHVAVHHQREDFVDLLLSRGADIEAVGDAGYTAFIQACRYSPRIVPLLFERGANVHAKFKSNAGALHAAAAGGNIETLEFLIGLGMDIEEKTLKGYTPLACALNWGREDAALCLLRHGASVHWVTLDTNETAFHFAARNGLEVAMGLLVQDADVNALDNEGWGPLHDACATRREACATRRQACATGTTKIVTALLNAGAGIEQPLPNGDRPLHVALINENEQIALLLLERGADIYALASRNRSPLHIAADHNLTSVASELLNRGLSVQVDHIDESTWTPLCYCRHVDIVKLLLQYGANVHYADKDGWTPLHQAVHNGERDVALALVAAGARLEDRTSDDGLSVVERAMHLQEWGDKGKQGMVGVKTLVSAAAKRKYKLLRKRRLMELEGKKKEEEQRVEQEKMKEGEVLEGLGGKFEILDLQE